MESELRHRPTNMPPSYRVAMVRGLDAGWMNQSGMNTTNRVASLQTMMTMLL